MKSMTGQELQAAVAEIPKWRLDEPSGKLVRDCEFGDFVEALAFVNRVGAMAEAQNHHPDIDIRYNKVKLGLVSHDAQGITQRDLRLARLLDAEFPG
jgi:4a-hydroxytetrahydrobiopterin dehydratase